MYMFESYGLAGYTMDELQHFFVNMTFWPLWPQMTPDWHFHTHYFDTDGI